MSRPGIEPWPPCWEARALLEKSHSNSLFLITSGSPLCETHLHPNLEVPGLKCPSRESNGFLIAIRNIYLWARNSRYIFSSKFTKFGSFPFRFAEVKEEGSSAGVPECSRLRPQGASRPSAGPHRGRKTVRGYSQLCQPEAKGRVGKYNFALVLLVCINKSK